MTKTLATVPWVTKAPGGTEIATGPTLMVCTFMARSLPKECHGSSGKKSNYSVKRSEMKIRPKDF